MMESDARRNQIFGLPREFRGPRECCQENSLFNAESLMLSCNDLRKRDGGQFESAFVSRATCLPWCSPGQIFLAPPQFLVLFGQGLSSCLSSFACAAEDQDWFPVSMALDEVQQPDLGIATLAKSWSSLKVRDTPLLTCS